MEAETAPPKTSGGGTMRRFPKRSVAPAASGPSAPPVPVAPAASSDSDADDEDSDAGDAPRRPSHRRRGRARGGRGRSRGRGRGRGRSRARRRSSRRSLGRPQFSPTDLRPPGWEVPDEPARPTVERVQDVFVNQILPWVQRQQMTRGLRRPGMWPTLAEALREHHLLHCPAFAKTGAPPPPKNQPPPGPRRPTLLPAHAVPQCSRRLLQPLLLPHHVVPDQRDTGRARPVRAWITNPSMLGCSSATS